MKACATIVWLLTLIIPICRTSRGQSVSGVINTYYQVTGVNTASNTLTVSDASGLSVGQRVLIYQAKGATYNTNNAATFGDISAANAAGAYEFNTICTINSNDVLLRDQFVNTYNATGQVQLVTLPSYSSVTIGGTVTAPFWDPATGTGGIVALEASGTITLSADIDVSGRGFQGGALVNWPLPTYDCSVLDNYNAYYYPFQTSGNFTGGKKGEGIGPYTTGKEYGRGKMTNGGGGGNNANSGGGGGGNYGAGGLGGQRAGVTGFNCIAVNPGIGGLSLSLYGYTTGDNRIFFGGGGGEGHENNYAGTSGGNGGGIIILSASTIAGLGGRLLADGAIGVNPNPLYVVDSTQAEGDGGGGGGAGGSIILNASAVTGSVTASANGAKGSNSSNRVNDCLGPGGGGGGGAIWAAGASFPATVTATVTGGANGIVSLGNSKPACRGASNGATAGAAGVTKSGYTAPSSIGTTCTVLALADIKYFKANLSGSDVLLSWELSSPDISADIRTFIVQRSSDAARFTPIATLSAVKDSTLYRYTDAGNVEGTLYYRLAWQNNNGSLSYSRIVTVSTGPAPANFSFRLQPNPALQHMTLTVFSTEEENAAVAISSAQGQLIQSFRIQLHTGTNAIPVDLRTLAPATYFLIVEEGGKRMVKPFIKKGE
ncbi:MAG TPA: T9SS type A sorting domain-containing protein [Puia sp.]|nr:T9SS type A sorting domain-containing protein [Puia sp.]